MKEKRSPCKQNMFVLAVWVLVLRDSRSGAMFDSQPFFLLSCNIFPFHTHIQTHSRETCTNYAWALKGSLYTMKASVVDTYCKKLDSWMNTQNPPRKQEWWEDKNHSLLTFCSCQKAWKSTVITAYRVLFCFIQLPLWSRVHVLDFGISVKADWILTYVSPNSSLHIKRSLSFYWGWT